MRCIRCGAELEPGVRSCPECGAPQPNNPPPSDPPTPVRARPPAPKKRRGWVWALLAVGGVLAVYACTCVGGFALLPLFGGSGSVEVPLPSAQGPTSGGSGPVAVSPSDAQSPVGAAASAVIGPEGGEVVGPGGARAIVPEGALAREAEIRIAEAPAGPEVPAQFLSSPAGPAYEVTMPEGTELYGAVELLLPLEYQEGVDGNLLTVFRWDGSTWWDVGGFVEGDAIRVQLDHFSIFRPVLSYAPRRSVGFLNHGPYDAVIRAWTYVPRSSDTLAPPPAASTVSFAPGAPAWPNPGRFLSLPMGTYTFCIDWTTDLDEDGDGFFDYYHYVDDRPVTLDENDPIPLDLVEQVDINTERIHATPGRCPLPPLATEPSPSTTTTAPPGTGDVTVRLTWYTMDDLDLHVIDPAGEEIFFANSLVASGGELDRDSNAICSDATTSPVENVFWPTGQAPRGQYTVQVHYFAECGGGGPVQFRLRIMADGSVVRDVSGTLGEVDDYATYEFTR